MTRNTPFALQHCFPAGSSSKVTEQNLKGTDIDSDSLKLKYILTKDPPFGKLLLTKSKRQERISVKGPVKSFTQEEVNKGGTEFFFFFLSSVHSLSHISVMATLFNGTTQFS